MRHLSSKHRGITNGLASGSSGRASGLTNGTGRGRTNGLTNGQGRGRTNGLTNGSGRTNGLTNGSGHGRTNGLTNGNGRTNGLTNGNGRTNGLTNGLGRTNGLTNGLTNGSGRTNGLTNGLGRTNGLGPMRGLDRQGAIGPKKLSAILILTFIIILPIAFGILIQSQPVPGHLAEIDGRFGDWDDRIRYVDTAMCSDAAIDITEFSIATDETSLYGYVQTQGNVLTRNAVDRFLLFVDSDNNGATGYAAVNLGADYLIEVYGYNSGSMGVSAMRFVGADQRNWSAFSQVGGGSADFADNRFEFRAMLDTELSTGGLKARFVTATTSGVGDICAPIVDGANEALVVTQTSRQTSDGLIMANDMLTLSLQATGGPVTLNSVTIDTNSIPAVSVSGLIAGTVLDVGRTITLQVTGGVGGLLDGAFVRAQVGSVSAGGALFSVVGEPLVAYKGAPPATIAVDGAFADWNSVTKVQDAPGDAQGANIDIIQEAAARQSQSFYSYVRFSATGKAMAGSIVPTTKLVPAGGGGGGGGGVTVLPRNTGEDIARIFIDSQNGGSMIGGIRADYVVEVKGVEGKVTSAQVYTYPGHVSRGAASGGAGGSMLEAGVALSLIGSPTGQVRMYVETTDWSGRKDSTTAIISNFAITFGTRNDGGNDSPDIWPLTITATDLTIIPILDATFNANEWSDATYAWNNDGTLYVGVKHDTSYLYAIVYAWQDGSPNDNDKCEILTDRLHNGHINGAGLGPQPDDRKFDCIGTYTFGVQPPPNTLTWIGNAGVWQVLGNNHVATYFLVSPGVIVYEYRIPIPEVWGVATPTNGQIAGFSVCVFDGGNGRTYNWDVQSVQNDPYFWNNIIYDTPEFPTIAIPIVISILPAITFRTIRRRRDG
jgi:hypothetical protein